MKQNQVFLIFKKDTKRRRIEQERKKMSKLNKRGSIKSSKNVIGHRMRRMDQLSNVCEGDKKSHP
jgi:hypothetical protein